MGISFFQQLFLIIILPLFCIAIVPAKSQCLQDQELLLLHFKNSLKFDSSLSTKLVSWNQTTDCCHWNGVTCNTAGYVIGLDLNRESISGEMDSSSSLFSLQFLQSLNLGFNNFNLVKIPAGLSNLASLTFLNLSNSGFAGQIPVDLSRLTRLVTLDLSALNFPLSPTLLLQNPNLAMLVQNMTELTQLYLDGVNISAQGYDWCQAISSSLPNLGVLSMSNCYLSGPIDSSLAKLRSLSVIRLDQNNLSSPVPQLLADFKNLTALRLASCNLKGVFPAKIFELPALQTLDVSYNGVLHGSLPEFSHDSPLQTLVLSYTNFTGALSYSFGNLGMVRWLDLSHCNFSGPIPNSMEYLVKLVYLDLSSNRFTGPIPSFQMFENLIHIDLSRNSLSGQVPSSSFEGLQSLACINLNHNSLTGSIPSSPFALASLRRIELSDNHFSGRLAEIRNASFSLLNALDLSGNNLEGPVPKSFFKLTRLTILLLSFNNLTDTIPLESFKRLVNLTNLDLSYNTLSIDTSERKSSLSSLPNIHILKLASCKLQSFPNMRNNSRLFHLDLSDNQIGGEIPNWLWELGNADTGTLSYLNVSHNWLVSLQEPYITPNLAVLDLHSNQLQGEIPITPYGAAYVDFSNNHFSSSIPADIGNNLAYASFFSVSNNNLIGVIPVSLCNASYLQVLDMSNNRFSGTIPSCLIELSQSLGVLNLGKNNLHGNISQTFPGSCSLRTLELNGNHLEGKIPESLANCTMLEVLNLGNNTLNDTFPCFLRNSSSLRVLALRFNNLHGGIQCGGFANSWPNLQIIDLASNYFTGDLPPNYFLSWRGMMAGKYDVPSKLNNLRFEFMKLSNLYYQDTVTVSNKGVEMELVKILTIFTSIDFSSNFFEGGIPDTIGELKSLYVLDLSQNALTGSIPRSIGNLKQLGSLDLSLNKISGTIPTELASLTFLSFLNLSYNQMAGKIPISVQFLTFTESSFEGNKGLCGPQLNIGCDSDKTAGSSAPTIEQKHSHPNAEVNWDYISAVLGYVVGLGVIVMPLVYSERWRDWYYKYADQVVFGILHQQEQARRHHGRRVHGSSSGN
ncbi:hypothetical protein RJ640_010245 [Escallonia rubra]|uniref:Leucine-rich repeat-containing N-terminal plant-type domain-containing protein n=1 Tax=Escallonia rubra TaxID=112253 RepID=A0AA88QLX8_9ASTE|nr:hypothetical protein RJ640_010245 [Escallonia rubra]